MYKDKEKQKATTKERVRRYRAKLKGVTHKPERNAQDVTPKVEPVVNAGDVVFKAIKDKAQNIHIKSSFIGPLTKEQQTSRKGFNE